jgi:hypothetical protein
LDLECFGPVELEMTNRKKEVVAEEACQDSGKEEELNFVVEVENDKIAQEA